MNNRKTWTGCLAAWIATSVLALQAQAATATVGGVKWNYSVYNNKAVLTSASPAKGALTIPSKLGGHPVATIAASAFANCRELTRVVVPEGVTSIQNAGFSGCTGLTSVKLPSTLTNLDSCVFEDCSSLKSVKLPSGLTGFWARNFTGCSSLTSFSFPKGITSIFNELAFCSNLVSVSFPAGLKSIEHNSFTSCSRLAAVDFPSGLQKIDGRSFAGCNKLKEVVIPASVEVLNGFESCRGLTNAVILGENTELGWAAFNGCTGLETLYVPASWKGTDKLSSASIPEWCKVKYVTYRLDLAASNRTFTAAAASGQKLAVTANVPWTAKSSAKWLTVKTASGSGNGKIKYDVAANAGTGSRTGKITVKGGGMSRTFKVTQKGLTDQVTTFKGNGGTPATQKTTNTIGKAYGKLPEAKWPGHALVGWFTKAEGGTQVKTNSTVTVAAKRTLYAHWTTKQVTTFKGNGGTPSTQKTTNTVGKTYGKLPKATWNNHVFLGWFTKATGGTQVTSDSKVTAATKRTLYAQWTDKQVTTFKGNNGTPSTQKTTNTMGKAYGKLPEAKRSGYAFVGWFTKAEGGTQVKTNSTVTVAAKRTLYAHWTDKQVTTFKGNGGTPATQKTTNTIGKAYGKLPAVSWPDHVFLGWADAAEGGEPVTADSTVTEAAKRTLYAVWKEDGGALPEIGSDSEVARVMARATDRRLAAKIANVAAYEDFRRWVTGKELAPEKVMESSHAWASYVLGADTLFENEPEIRLEGLSADGNGTRASGGPSTLRIRVTVKDGGKTAAVDAAKVATLFAATGNLMDWTGDARLVPSAESLETAPDGTMTFDVKAGTAPASRVFLGIRE